MKKILAVGALLGGIGGAVFFAPKLFVDKYFLWVKYSSELNTTMLSGFSASLLVSFVGVFILFLTVKEYLAKKPKGITAKS